MILADLHTHSDNSSDGENSMIEMCESAIEKNLNYIAFTDHCDIDLYEKELCEISLRQSYFDMLKVQNIFCSQLTVLKGLELGNALYDKDLAKKTAGRRSYDLILGSLHHPTGVEDFAFIDFETMDVSRLLGLYFGELEELIDWGCFDVLAHVTYPLRYINGVHKRNVDIRDYEEKLTRIFSKLIESGKGLEINTSGLRQPYGRTMPDLWCLRLYREAGGSIVTVGSDAHTAKEVGANITDGLSLAKEAGFENYCIYRQREPVYIKIED